MPKPIKYKSIDFFTHLVQLEEAFHLKLLNRQNIQDMIQLYAQLVELYDLAKDPIKSYFMHKIQFVLSRPECIKNFIGSEIRFPINPYISNIPISIAPSLTEILDEKQIMKNLNENHSSHQQRGLQMQLTIDLQKQKFQQPTSVQHLFNDYTEERNKMNELYINSLTQQQQILEEKLKQRKQRLTENMLSPI